jgi:predicted secreted hydrolase
MTSHRFLYSAALFLTITLWGCKPQAPTTPESDLAVLAQGAAGYAQAQPGARLDFPRDHGAHPDFRIEWWYLTANLEDDRGRLYGLQWTLFRYALQPPGQSEPETPWQDPQLFMAHLGLTWPGGHEAFQRYARGGDHGGVVQAGAAASPFAAWLDDWSLASTGPDWLPLAVQARQGDYGAELVLEGRGPIVLQGQQGYSQKHPEGGGSFYYSQPFLAASGELRIDGVAVEVTGQAWLDREWSSQFLQPDQAGWDWFATHLDNGEKLMLFQLRTRGEGANYRHGVLIAPDGGKQPLDPERIHFEVLEETTVAGRSLPLQWRMDLPEIGRSLEIVPVHPDQWMDVDFPYWEGAVKVQGDGPQNSGRGYMELTGYALQ